MPSRGPALTFDPQNVDFVISAWQQQGFVTLETEYLQRLAAERAERNYARLTMMGLSERHAKQSAIKSAVALLKSLKLIKQLTSGERNNRVVTVALTPLGRETLTEEPAAGTIHVRLVGLLVKSSPQLTTLLRVLAETGPLSRPVANPLPGTPHKGAAFNRALLDGLATFDVPASAIPMVAARSTTRQTATQALKTAATAAIRRHPASALPGFEKVGALAADLGLLWRDVEQVNQALGIESIGLAAVPREGTFYPNVPAWPDIASRFQEALMRVYLQRVESSGFATVGSLRGGIGREIQIPAAVVDAFLCLTREAGDRGECPVTLQFEPDDDLLYAVDRRPLIWQGTAFDFVEVHRLPNVLPAVSRTSALRRRDSTPSS